MAENISETMASIKATLRSIEIQLTEGGFPSDGLADFKASIDDIRLRIWAVLTAGNVDEYQAFSRRFRLRRAREICRAVNDDFGHNGVYLDPTELESLREEARKLVAAIERTTAGGDETV
jgi:hypothetical protein